MSEPMVSVPRRLLQELNRFAEAQPEVGVLVDDRQGVWTESMVDTFRKEIEHRYTHAAQVFQAAAKASPNILRYREFVQKSGLNAKQVSAELGAASKAARRLLGRVTWPMVVDDTSEGATYRMPLEVARWWLQA